jgi:hypothetical protein
MRIACARSRRYRGSSWPAGHNDAHDMSGLPPCGFHAATKKTSSKRLGDRTVTGDRALSWLKVGPGQGFQGLPGLPWLPGLPGQLLARLHRSTANPQQSNCGDGAAVKVSCVVRVCSPKDGPKQLMELVIPGARLCLPATSLRAAQCPRAQASNRRFFHLRNEAMLSSDTSVTLKEFP